MMMDMPSKWQRLALSLAMSVPAAACVLHAAIVAAQTPEQAKMWEAERVQAQAEQKARAEQLAAQRAARKADPMGWVRTLDPMSAGGWTFRAVGAEGTWATFSTDHQLKHSGHTVTVWLRQEFPEPQKSPDGDFYSSDVERLQFDCTKEQARALIVIYYSANNLAGNQRSEEADIKQLPWEPIVPGTQSEVMIRWACGAAKGH
jgi:hypothetical protein